MKDAMLAAAKASAIPEGKQGLWWVRKVSIALPLEVDHGERKVAIPPGTYTNLYRLTIATLHRTAGECVMNDMPDELHKHLGFMLRASGRVLVSGLGLGCVVRGLLVNPKVTHITVVEKSSDVIALVFPYMPTDNRLQIIHADVFEFAESTTEQFDCAWHDIWTDESEGEPHLAVAHCKLMALLRDRVTKQGAWAFPRECARRIPNWIG